MGRRLTLLERFTHLNHSSPTQKQSLESYLKAHYEITAQAVRTTITKMPDRYSKDTAGSNPSRSGTLTSAPSEAVTSGPFGVKSAEDTLDWVNRKAQINALRKERYKSTVPLPDITLDLSENNSQPSTDSLKPSDHGSGSRSESGSLNRMSTYGEVDSSDDQDRQRELEQDRIEDRHARVGVVMWLNAGLSDEERRSMNPPTEEECQELIRHVLYWIKPNAADPEDGSDFTDIEM